MLKICNFQLKMWYFSLGLSQQNNKQKHPKLINIVNDLTASQNFPGFHGFSCCIVKPSWHGSVFHIFLVAVKCQFWTAIVSSNIACFAFRFFFIKGPFQWTCVEQCAIVRMSWRNQFSFWTQFWKSDFRNRYFKMLLT